MTRSTDKETIADANTGHKTVQARIIEYAEAIGFAYEVSWNMVRRDIFSWKLLEPQMARMSADECR